MKCPILSLCSCIPGSICVFCLQLMLVVLSMIMGTLLIFQPKRLIDMQIALYRVFNWKLEPISLEKEIRNMRILGATALILSLIVLVIVILGALKI